uniref:Integrase catalytic domain-containing protein n=1 Tax=Trichuris muris TaxID=70415 RepID=A0A5S6QTJ4_TRIMR
MLIQEIHANRGHSGIEDTMAAVRSRAWIIDLRMLVRRTLSKCISCRRQIGTPPKLLFGWLPKVRVQRPVHVFAYTRLDFFGPFLVSVRRSVVKRWICLFTCLTVRAVRLEVCHNLDADSFLAAFRRFMSRRGAPAVCVSDIGTNFVAGDRILREGIKQLNNSDVKEFMVAKNIEWRFNPPNAPNFGGSWERLIGCAKRALATILKGQSVTEEVFHTVVVKVEGLLNGRPLTHVSSDSRDAEPLTPNHFLLGRPYASLPPCLYDDSKSISRKSWEAAQVLVNRFWRRWLTEYLPFLASLHKCRKPEENLREGDVVLIVDVSNPRGTWPIGTVTKVYPGPDKIVRVADVRCSRGTLRRPTTRLIKLTSLISGKSETPGEDVVA